MKVYVSASSQEIDRASRWTAMLRQAGFDVVSTWIEKIAEVGIGNPREASKGDRMNWAITDLDEVGESELFWMLAPKVGSGRGAYAELGFSIGYGKRAHIISGDTKQSIFCAVAAEYAEDAEAFQMICAYRDIVQSI